MPACSAPAMPDFSATAETPVLSAAALAAEEARKRQRVAERGSEREREREREREERERLRAIHVFPDGRVYVVAKYALVRPSTRVLAWLTLPVAI